MKRRTFLLGGGLLATLSLSATATNAALTDAVAAAADFRVIADASDSVSSFTINPDNENTESQHTWELDINSNEDIDRIEANYNLDGDNASFDPLTEGDITVEFFQNGKLNPLRLANADYTGATATFTIDSNKRQIEGQANVIIGGDVSVGDPGIVNPSSGTYEPELTFVQADGDTQTFQATMTTSTGDGFFEISNVSVSTTDLTVGNDVVIDFDVTNTGAGTDSRNVDLNINPSDSTKRLDVDTQGFTLDPNETKSGSFTYTAQSSDKPSFVAEVEGDTAQQSSSISVTGGWSLTLTAGKKGGRSIHTWNTDGINFSEDVDTITIRYPSNVDKNALNFSKSTPTVTIDLTNTNNVSYTESITNGGSTATWDLADGSEDTNIGGSASIEIDSLRDPAAGTYDAVIELVGVSDETYSTTVSFTI